MVRRVVNVVRRLGAAVIVLGLLVVACSSGGDKPLTAGRAKPGFVDYCAKRLAVEAYPQPDLRQLGTLEPAAQVAVVRGTATQILPMVEQAVAAAPEQLRADGAILVGAVKKAAETGARSDFEAPAFREAETRVHASDLTNCGWASADVTATEYSFSGVPKLMKAGPLSLQLTNKGKEVHELTLFRVDDDTTESVKKIVGLPREEALRDITVIGTAAAEPGTTDYRVFDLTPGRYGVACFVPLGENGDGPLHASEGMYASFSVT